ncbi:MAG: peptidyl-prolyl cis-trans isomerase [Sedimentisphaerales bacterium]|nr:peptidyl-prolyl cis-trans isomerase [Sedimentisphaerales bacterium]
MATQVKLETSMGDIIIKLDSEAAPQTCENFLSYVEKGFYDGTIFHRVIPNFMIQGGGMTCDMQPKATDKPIPSEADNGLTNQRGTIAMARTGDPNSATSQFFINQRDNDFLNFTGPKNPGYAVFGNTIQGMDIIDTIAGVDTTQRGQYEDVPVEPVMITSIKIVADV